MRRNVLGIAALVLSLAALGLSVIPGIALGQPFPLMAAPKDPPQPKPGFTVKFKKISFTVGGNRADTQQQQAADRKASLLTWFTLSAVACSLIGLALGPISWVREKQPALSGSAIAICCLALIWQYLIVGIVIGVACAAFLVAISQIAT